MNPKRKYGVVYTPNKLADFLASLIQEEAIKDNYEIQAVLDPACGEGALLSAIKRISSNNNIRYFGIDVDNDAITSLTSQTNDNMTLYCLDTILPPKSKSSTMAFWQKRLPSISAVIANPPWSSEKVYSKEQLVSAGFKFSAGQYDSYVLFLELAYEIVKDGGYIGFIIPDSLFESQNENLRRFLTEKTKIKVIARLGEKIFEEVNRATTVIVCKKELPDESDNTMCFRLNTEQRKIFLNSNILLKAFYDKEKHPVKQLRFLANEHCNFDIDTRICEENLLEKIKSNCIDWNKKFIFGRGVEISKKGDIANCPYCGHAQGYMNSQIVAGKKDCIFCKKSLPLNETTLGKIVKNTPFEECKRILVGENIKRYAINGENYIRLNILGINYKNQDLYLRPKLLIRKTGLGIYACVDYSGGLTSQTVYIIRYKDDDAPPLEYYLALLNSRVVYYYYLKVYGENEWKSHPYFTKKIIYSLPLRKYDGNEIDQKITTLAKKLCKAYDYGVDLELEKLIMTKYEITKQEYALIANEMELLPNLSAINGMKFEGGNIV